MHAVAAIAAKALVATVARQRHRDVLARELAHAIGGDGGAVGVGLVIERGQGVDEVEVVGFHRLDEVIRAVAVRHFLRKFGLVELGVVKADGAGIDRRVGQPGHDRDHRAGVDATGQEGSQRHLGDHAQAYGFAQARGELGAGVGEADVVVEGEFDIPVLPGLWNRQAAADAQRLAGAELLGAQKDGAGLGDVAQREVLLHRQRVHAAIERGVLHQHLELGAKGERAVLEQGVEHRFDRQTVARHEQGVALAVVEAKRKHAAKTLHAVLAPGLPGMDDDFGVAAGVEDVTERFELGDEFLEVVDLAVEHHRDRAIFIEQRLLSRGQIDDGQPAVSERDAGLEVIARLVRATMVLDVTHALHQGAIEVALAAGIEEAGDAAHDEFLGCWV